MTHIYVSKLTIIGSDNGLSPDRRQAIIWTNAGLLLIGPLGTNFSEILIEILTFSFKNIRFKMSSAKRRPFCLGLNVLNHRNWTAYSTVCVIFYWTVMRKSFLWSHEVFLWHKTDTFSGVHVFPQMGYTCAKSHIHLEWFVHCKYQHIINSWFLCCSFCRRIVYYIIQIQ